MAKTYRRLHQWDQWLAHFLGSQVLAAEKAMLFSFLEKLYGKHTLLIGTPKQHTLLEASVMPQQLLVSPLFSKSIDASYIESDLHELPIASGLVDLVIVPHTFELIDNPQQLLTEACRIVKPDGHIIVFGFNPYSFWGLKKRWMKSKNSPWSNHFTEINKIKNWLSLAEFQLMQQETFFFRPPIQHASLFKKLKWLEKLGEICFSPFGGIYMLMAQSKSIPLTPIKMRWQQQLSGVRATIPKPTIRSIRNSS